MICIICSTQFAPPDNCPLCGWDIGASINPNTVCAPGDVLAARYSIQEYLGQGRFGACFRATDFKTNSEVAIKFIHPTFLPTEKHQKTFVDGMLQMRDKSHPVAAKLIDVGQLNDHTYASTEFLAGSSLEELIAARIPSGQSFTVREIFPILKEAVACLIESPLAKHGLICPENICLQSGNIKIFDSGLVANLPQTAVAYKLSCSQKNQRYVAPEILNNSTFSPRSDVYSLGVILGEMLSLHMFNGQIEMFQQTNPSISTPVIDVLHNALAEDKNDRYKDAEMFLMALCDAAGIPAPYLNRMWLSNEDSVVQEVPENYQADKTAQIVMKDVIQQHYEEVTSVTRNPLLDTKSNGLPRPPSNPPLPKPRSTQSSDAATRAPATAVALPKPSIAPPISRPPSVSASKSSAPPTPQILSLPKPGTVTQKQENSQVFKLDQFMHSPPRPSIDAIENIDDVSRVTPPAPVPTRPSAAQKSNSLDGIDPRFLRAAKALERHKDSVPPAPNPVIKKELEDINPRFLRAAKKLQHTQINEVQSAAQDSALFDDTEDWRDRISQESTSNEDSVVSFLSPAPSSQKNSSVSGFPKHNSEAEMRLSPPPPPPPPPRPKR